MIFLNQTFVTLTLFVVVVVVVSLDLLFLHFVDLFMVLLNDLSLWAGY